MVRINVVGAMSLVSTLDLRNAIVPVPSEASFFAASIDSATLGAAQNTIAYFGDVTGHVLKVGSWQ